MPIALEDRPREHRQDVYCLDLLNDNALIVCAPQRGATNAVMTMVTTGSLMYRPDRVQFYCIAASGPQLAAMASLPHVAAVAPVAGPRGRQPAASPRCRASSPSGSRSSPGRD